MCLRGSQLKIIFPDDPYEFGGFVSTSHKRLSGLMAGNNLEPAYLLISKADRNPLTSQAE